MIDETRPARYRHKVPEVSMSFGTIEDLLRTRVVDRGNRPDRAAQIDRFEVLGIIGNGGIGIVLRARDPRTSQEVAIKVLRPELVADPQAVHRFLVEARHMQRLAHPNIVELIEVSDRPEGPYFVMPFMAKGSLKKLLREEDQLTREETLHIASQVADALAFAHSKGIIHRDIKPGNVLVDRNGDAYLTDFGLVRTFYNDSIVDVRRPQCEGTAPYMSPAVAAGEAEDTRCDIYAFGALLREMITGSPPYRGDSVPEIINQVRTGPPPPIRSLNPDADEKLSKIAEGAMARELRDRYATMDDVLSDLRRAEKAEAPLGPSGHPDPTRHRWRRRGVLLTAAVILCGLGALVVVQTLLKEGFGSPSFKNSIGMEMVQVPAGEFMMGSKLSMEEVLGRYGGPEKGSNDEHPQHPVRITKPFYMGKYEVTVGQFRRFVEDTGYVTRAEKVGWTYAYVDGKWLHGNGANWRDPKGFSQSDDHPVVDVSWKDATTFCDWLSQKEGRRYRLPTEAEWEYACRAGTETVFWWGDEMDTTGKVVNVMDIGYFGDPRGTNYKILMVSDGFEHTAPVGYYGAEGANGFGLHDMIGNVEEWCRDGYAEYPASAVSDPEGPPSVERRAIRGGAWDSFLHECRSAARYRHLPLFNFPNLGFRVLLEIE